MSVPWAALGGVVVSVLASVVAQRAAGPRAVAIDHLILGINHLDDGIEEFERATGVKPERGGEHPGRGTQNALVGLGDGRYLEIMAPLATAEKPAPIPFTRLTPYGWALHASDLAGALARLEAAGFTTTGPTPGSRRRPDGSLLQWQTGGAAGAGLGLAPFLIQWAAGTPHPAATSPAGCTFESVDLADPHPETLQRLLHAVGFEADVRAAASGMRLTLRCPKGEVSFGF